MEFAACVGADSNWNISTLPQCAPDLANGLVATKEDAAARILVLLADYLSSQGCGSKLWLSLPALAPSRDVGNKKGHSRGKELRNDSVRSDLPYVWL